MDFDGPGAISSPGTEEETIARKRSRRVSFADTTAVHVFDRDEDFETPPEERSASPSPSARRSLAESDDGNDTSDAGSPAPPIIFLRDIDSSSPGSAAGSVVSADENFFGPVSTSFIQIGRTSDAGMSEDDNNDITLDSRTFSMHFLNTVLPEESTANSVASLRTPDTASMGHLEELSEPGRKSSSGRDALTDMNMLTGNPRTYNYGKLSPTLNDILQKIEQGEQRKSPIAGIAAVNPHQVLALTATEEECMEDNSSIGNVISSNESGAFSITDEHISMRNAFSTNSDPIQKDDAMITDGLAKSQAEQLHQQNEVMDTETILRTPRTVAQQLEVTQGSISTMRSQRQKIFSPTPLSKCRVKCQEASSSSVEIVIHDQRMENLLKLRHQESPAASQLPLVERNKLDIQANDLFRGNEDHDSTLLVSCNSPRRQREKTGESFATGVPPGQRLNEAASVQSTSCDVLNLDSQLSRECNSYLDLDGEGRIRSAEDDNHAVHEWPEETSKAASSPKKSRQQLSSASELPVLLKVSKEKQSGNSYSGLSVNIDCNKLVCTISNATEQVLTASINKLNVQQLDALDDKLDDFQMARKYRKLSGAVRVEDCCRDQQKRLAEAQSLHERLLYEQAKLQIHNVKLAELRNKSQQCQIGTQECSFLKSKILGVAQKCRQNNASLHDTSLIGSNDGQELLALVSQKRLQYNVIHQKLENVRSSLEYFHNNKVDISCQSVMRCAEDQLDMRNQCCIIQLQAGVPKLMDVLKRDNKRIVILNYRNLLFQRIILNISYISSIFVNNSLNGNRIGQVFLDLNASVAFNYIFKAEENQSISDLQSLQKKTMETSLLLGNLVDVLDEIKFAKVMLLNLTSAAFVLESQTCKLALRLCFRSFRSGKSIDFTIDMTDLNRSVYPSEPSELLINLGQAQTTLSQPSIEEIMVSIRNLQPGRTVILRLCRMVSQLIQALQC